MFFDFLIITTKEVSYSVFFLYTAHTCNMAHCCFKWKVGVTLMHFHIHHIVIGTTLFTIHIITFLFFAEQLQKGQDMLPKVFLQTWSIWLHHSNKMWLRQSQSTSIVDIQKQSRHNQASACKRWSQNYGRGIFSRARKLRDSQNTSSMPTQCWVFLPVLCWRKFTWRKICWSLHSQTQHHIRQKSNLVCYSTRRTRYSYVWH